MPQNPPTPLHVLLGSDNSNAARRSFHITHSSTFQIHRAVFSPVLRLPFANAFCYKVSSFRLSAQRLRLPAADDYQNHRQQENKPKQKPRQPPPKGGQVHLLLGGIEVYRLATPCTYPIGIRCARAFLHITTAALRANLFEYFRHNFLSGFRPTFALAVGVFAMHNAIDIDFDCIFINLATRTANPLHAVLGRLSD